MSDRTTSAPRRASTPPFQVESNNVVRPQRASSRKKRHDYTSRLTQARSFNHIRRDHDEKFIREIATSSALCQSQVMRFHRITPQRALSTWQDYRAQRRARRLEKDLTLLTNPCCPYTVLARRIKNDLDPRVEASPPTRTLPFAFIREIFRAVDDGLYKQL